ncbi:MAG: hypothetical protein AABX11_01675 [Nanoarchaeota archaeon]
MQYLLKSLEEIDGTRILGVEQIPSLLEQLFGKKFDSGHFYREGVFWYSYPKHERVSHHAGLILKQVERQIFPFEVYEALRKQDTF